MKIKDIMTREVVTVAPDTKVREVASLISQKNIGAVPVLDDAGRLVGLITASDLFIKERGVPFSMVKIPQILNQWVEPGKITDFYDDIDKYTASDVMSSPVITISPEEEVGEAASLMFEHHISRLPVMDSNKLVGILSRSDIIRLMAESH
jgi:predicted transcriptional regulator